MKSKPIQKQKYSLRKTKQFETLVIELNDENMQKLYEISKGINNSISSFFEKTTMYEGLDGSKYTHLYVSNTPQKKMKLVLMDSDNFNNASTENHLSTYKNSKTVVSNIFKEYKK